MAGELLIVAVLGAMLILFILPIPAFVSFDWLGLDVELDSHYIAAVVFCGALSMVSCVFVQFIRLLIVGIGGLSMAIQCVIANRGQWRRPVLQQVTKTRVGMLAWKKNMKMAL